VRGCGIETAATIEYRGASRDEDPLLTPRLPVSNDPIEILEAKVRGRLDLLGTWRSRVPSWVTGRMSSGRKRARAAV